MKYAILSLMAGVAAVLGGAAAGAAAERPNIVFILCDDLAPWALGVSGHPEAQTPNIDRLFREGAYLVNSFAVTPVCSPSRAALVASRYGTELAITDYLSNRETDLGLDRRNVIWPGVLARGGYRTGLVGKWHLGVKDEFHPTKFGYEHFMGFRGGGATPMNPKLEVAGQEKERSGYGGDLLTDEAIAFVGQRDPRPFLLSLHFREPHAPYLPTPDEDWAPFQHLDPTIPNPDFPKLDVPRTKKMTREYLASIRSIDRNVGRLLAELDRLKLAENTVVIFTSDHGYNMGHNGMWHKGNGHWILTEPPPGTENVPRGERPNMYDNSLRVSTGIRWPAGIKPGTIVTRTVSHLDWYPTLVALAGLDVPPEQGVRGRNFLPLLKGERIDWDDDLYAEYSTHHNSKTHMRAWRTPEWKLIRDFKNPERDELYDLKHDPAETTNLIGSTEHRAVAAKEVLQQKLLARMRLVNDPVLKREKSAE